MSLDHLDLKHNILYFIHIPKTSGTALTSKQIIKFNPLHQFNISGLKRTPYYQNGYKENKTDTWEVYKYPIKNNYKITIIRNPFDLLCSYYHHGETLKQNNEYCNSGWNAVNFTHKFKTFKEFILSYCDPNFNWHIPCLKNFLFGQLFDDKHNCVADIIIKYEYLDKAIEILNKKMKYPIEKNKYDNISKRKIKNYKDYYDEEMIKLVYKKCSKELEYFNYNFNGSTKEEPLIINTKIKYDVKNDFIYS